MSEAGGALTDVSRSSNGVGNACGATTTHLELTLAEVLFFAHVAVQTKHMLAEPAGRQDTMQTPHVQVGVVVGTPPTNTARVASALKVRGIPSRSRRRRRRGGSSWLLATSCLCGGVTGAAPRAQTGGLLMD